MGCDGNNNAGLWGNADYNKMNEFTDGSLTACNNLSWKQYAERMILTFRGAWKK